MIGFFFRESTFSMLNVSYLTQWLFKLWTTWGLNMIIQKILALLSIDANVVPCVGYVLHSPVTLHFICTSFTLVFPSFPQLSPVQYLHLLISLHQVWVGNKRLFVRYDSIQSKTFHFPFLPPLTEKWDRPQLNTYDLFHISPFWHNQCMPPLSQINSHSIMISSRNLIHFMDPQNLCIAWGLQCCAADKFCRLIKMEGNQFWISFYKSFQVLIIMELDIINRHHM